LRRILVTVLAVILISFALNNTVLGWNAVTANAVVKNIGQSVSTTTIPAINVLKFPEIHQYILDKAYDRLERDPAFDGSNFPSRQEILSHEGVKAVAIDYVRQVDPPLELTRLEKGVGPGPDSAGASKYSDHYYNPRTEKGGAPDVAGDNYDLLRTELEKNLDSKKNLARKAKAATYLAHYVADMSCGSLPQSSLYTNI
jgi:hypothetical protein